MAQSDSAPFAGTPPRGSPPPSSYAYHPSAAVSAAAAAAAASAARAETDDDSSAFVPLFDSRQKRDRRRYPSGFEDGGVSSSGGSSSVRLSIVVVLAVLTVLCVVVLLGSALLSLTSPYSTSGLTSLDLFSLLSSFRQAPADVAASGTHLDSPSSSLQQPDSTLVSHLLACLHAEQTASLPASITLHTPAARPILPLNLQSACWAATDNGSAALLNSSHSLAQLEYQLAVRRMAASDDELDYFDPLDDRAVSDSAGTGPTVPYPHLPSRIIEWRDFDRGVESGAEAGGGCEWMGLGHGAVVHRQPVYVGVDMAVREDPQVGNLLHLFTHNENVSRDEAEKNKCTPTAWQSGQDQAHAEVKLVTAANSEQYFCGRPPSSSAKPYVPVVYFMSRHNVNTPWHVIIEHIYPHFINSHLRGDFPLKWDELVAWQNSHLQMYDWHLTGQHGSTAFEYWWTRLFGAEVQKMNSSTRVCCSMCILSPPKVLTVYDYWQQDRFVFDSHSQVMVRLFRRHLFARNNVAAFDRAKLLTFSFQTAGRRDELQSEYAEARQAQQGAAVGGTAVSSGELRSEQQQSSKSRVQLPSPMYQVPDIAALLSRELEYRSRQAGKQVELAELNVELGWNWESVMRRDRTRLFSPSAYRSVNGSIPPRFSHLPLVVYAMRGGSGDRDVHEMERWWGYYSRADVADSLPYHLLFVHIEDLPWQDHFALLGRAAMLIAVEGAGLLNILLLPLRSVVLELECTRRNYNGNRPLPWHQSLSQYLGHMHIQWSLETPPSCTFDQRTVERMHDTIVQSLHSKERNKYVYVF